MKNRLAFLFIAIFLLALLMRLPGLGSFMTADEANWMIRSGDFWHALFLRHDPGGTFQTSHPGVVTMWVAGAGIFWQEARLGYHIDEGNLAHFRLAATLPIAFAISFLIALTAWNLQRLWPKYMWLPYLAGFFLAVDPYLVGMSQIVHLDALLCLLMLNTLVFALRYVAYPYGQRPIQLLILTGCFAGLSLLNKFFEAVWLAPFLGILFFVHVQGSFHERLRAAVPKLLFLVGVASLTLFILWPALWGMKNTTQYFARDAVTISTVDTTDISSSDDALQGSAFYARVWLGRLPLFTMIISLGALAVLVRVAAQTKKIHPLLWLVLYSVTYLLFISLVAKKADRYALPALVVWPTLTAWGVAVAIRSAHNLAGPSKKIWVYGAVSLVLVASLAQTAIWSPYAIAYNNELFAVRPLSQQGWGEGLDAAARWLNQNPLGSNLSVAAWYPTVFGTYFHGLTYSLSSRDDQRIGMVVLYRNMLGRGPDDDGTNVWDEFKDKKPLQVFSIQGQPYVWVFEMLRLRYFPRTTGELVGTTQVGQLVPIADPNWRQLDLGLATYSSRGNTHDVIVHIRSQVNSREDIRTITRNASQIIDSDWNTFSFEPISDSAGKTYFIFVTSPDSVPGDAISVRYSDKDIRPGEMFWRHRLDKDASTNQDFLVPTADLAYRIP